MYPGDDGLVYRRKGFADNRAVKRLDIVPGDLLHGKAKNPSRKKCDHKRDLSCPRPDKPKAGCNARSKALAVASALIP